MEKLHGAFDCYKARIGDYRVGIYLDKSQNQVKVATVFHRGKGNKTFP
jgi:mRNA-degrading endonuclease RelE of RelBE toxin-antitoxin system